MDLTGVLWRSRSQAQTPRQAPAQRQTCRAWEAGLRPPRREAAAGLTLQPPDLEETPTCVHGPCPGRCHGSSGRLTRRLTQARNFMGFV